jgi:hypothetical protein
MKKDITKINNFLERWGYQQKTYLKLMWGSIKCFSSHFPMGYANLFLQLVISIVSLPIYLGQALEYWVNSMLLTKPTLEDVGNVEDSEHRALIAKAQRKAIDEYKDITKTLLTFLLGVLTTVITLYFSTKIFR